MRLRRLLVLGACSLLGLGGCGAEPSVAAGDDPTPVELDPDPAPEPEPADEDAGVGDDASPSELPAPSADAGGAPADAGSPPPTDPPPPGDPELKSVLVYSNNIENMLYDWKDLVHVMARDSRNVDVFLVQQLTDKKRLDELAAYMSARLGEQYTGIVAQDHPTHLRFGDQVLPKPTVTTGVIWRAARFALLSHQSWFPWGTKSGGEHTCSGRTDNSGYETLRVRLSDKLAARQLAVVSLRHWTWQDCSLANMLEMIDGQPTGANAHAAMPDLPLQIVGGDFNGPAFDSTGDFRCWYRVSVAGLGGQSCAGHENLGFGEPLYDQCQGKAACVAKDSGIDFVFGRRAGGKPASSSGFEVVSYAKGDAADVAETGGDKLSNKVATHGFDDVTSNYSGHRARRALFFYE